MTIRLSAARMAGTVSVQYSTADGSAVSPSDYDAGSGSAVIRAGETSVTVSVPIAEDSVPESTSAGCGAGVGGNKHESSRI